MDPTKDDDTRVAELLEALKNCTPENTGAVSGAIGVDNTMVYGGGYSADTITIPSPSTSWTSGSSGIDFGNLSPNIPNITLSGGTGYNFSNTTITAGAGIYSAVGSPWLNNGSSGVLDLAGENADIKINGKSLVDTLKALEERLNILVPNTKLEADWDELRELGERYRALEKQCEEKAAMWEKLKSMPAPTIT